MKFQEEDRIVLAHPTLSRRTGTIKARVTIEEPPEYRVRWDDSGNVTSHMALWLESYATKMDAPMAAPVTLDEARAKTPRARAKAPRARVLNTALGLTTGERNVQYGPPAADFHRTADLLHSLGFRVRVGDDGRQRGILPSDVARIMICLKLSRTMWAYKEDNWVDIAGYAACGGECEEGEHAAV